MLGRIKNLLSKALFGISAPRCVSCRQRLGSSDRAICHECFEKYLTSKERGCSVCSKRLSECSCPCYYLKTHFVSSLSKLVRYNVGYGSDVSSRIIYRMKKKRRRDVIDFVAEEMAECILKSHSELSADTLVTHVPNRSSAIRERGFDHAEVLAQAVADRLGLEFKPLLVSLSKLPQKSMSGHDRVKNARFDLICETDLSGRDVIIIDDVVTSGASMGNSASMIRALRPRHIYGAAVAIAYKDEKILNNL